MNWKKLSKLVLVLALIVATLGSSLLVARAEPITDEVDDSTIINDDGGGTGSGGGYRGTRYCYPHGAVEKNSWQFIRIEWEVDGHDVKAYALYGGLASSYAEVQADVKPVRSQPGHYKATVTAEKSLTGYEYTDVMSTYHSNHEWILDRFEWDKTDGVKANAVFHCRYNRNDTCEVPAFTCKSMYFTDGPFYYEYHATVGDSNRPDYPSPDGKQYNDYLEYDSHHRHEWVFDRIEWDLSRFVWGKNFNICAYAVFHCPNACHTERFVPATVSLKPSTGDIQCNAYVSTEDSLDHWEYWDSMTIEHLSHEWVFDRIEWDRSEGIKAYALYHCSPDYCHEQLMVPATVTYKGNKQYVATVPATAAPDETERTDEMYTNHTDHNWVFDRFEWDVTDHWDIKADAVYHCSYDCSESHRIAATVKNIRSQPGLYQATVTDAESPDEEGHTEVMSTYHTDHNWIFDGFEWDTTDGVKATAVYHCSYGCSETHRIEASVTKVPGTVVPTYVAKITAEQSADHKAHSGRKIVTPTPKPFPKPVIDDNPIVGPWERREIDPGKPIIVTPILNPIKP